MKVKTSVKGGRLAANHNETLARATGLKVRTNVKAGRLSANHNGTLVRDAA
jgi:hypothetical protein